MLNLPAALHAHLPSALHQKKSCDVDDRDYFWNSFGAYTFPKVAEEVETQLKAYRAAVEEINKKTSAGPQVWE